MTEEWHPLHTQTHTHTPLQSVRGHSEDGSRLHSGGQLIRPAVLIYENPPLPSPSVVVPCDGLRSGCGVFALNLVALSECDVIWPVPLHPVCCGEPQISPLRIDTRRICKLEFDS